MKTKIVLGVIALVATVVPVVVWRRRERTEPQA